MDEEILTLMDVVRELKMSDRTVRRYLDAGLIKATKKQVGRGKPAWQIKRSDLINYMKRYCDTETKCCGCARSCGGCSWTDGTFRPVLGWKASPTKIRMGGRIIESYHVESCPMFQADEPNRYVDGIVDESLGPLIFAMLNRMIADYAELCVRSNADPNSDKLLTITMQMNQIERYVQSPIFEDMVDAVKLSVSGPKLLDLVRADPLGTLERIRNEGRGTGYTEDYNE